LGLSQSPGPPPAWTGPIRGVSFSPFRSGQDPARGWFPSREEMRGDVARLSVKTHWRDLLPWRKGGSPPAPRYHLWAAILAVQSLPYASALVLSLANAFPARTPAPLPASRRATTPAVVQVWARVLSEMPDPDPRRRRWARPAVERAGR
jgi:hypothetical protein